MVMQPIITDGTGLATHGKTVGVKDASLHLVSLFMADNLLPVGSCCCLVWECWPTQHVTAVHFVISISNLCCHLAGQVGTGLDVAESSSQRNQKAEDSTYPIHLGAQVHIYGPVDCTALVGGLGQLTPPQPDDVSNTG